MINLCRQINTKTSNENSRFNIGAECIRWNHSEPENRLRSLLCKLYTVPPVGCKIKILKIYPNKQFEYTEIIIAVIIRSFN